MVQLSRLCFFILLWKNKTWDACKISKHIFINICMLYSRMETELLTNGRYLHFSFVLSKFFPTWMVHTTNLLSHLWLLCEFVLGSLFHIIWGLVSIIRMRGNHENYGFLVHYFNKYLPSANKNNIYCRSGKQKGTAPTPQNLLFTICIVISKGLVSKCKIMAMIDSLKVCA